MSQHADNNGSTPPATTPPTVDSQTPSNASDPASDKFRLRPDAAGILVFTDGQPESFHCPWERMVLDCNLPKGPRIIITRAGAGPLTFQLDWSDEVVDYLSIYIHPHVQIEQSELQARSAGLFDRLARMASELE